MFMSWMLIMPSFKKRLIAEQFQRNYINTEIRSTRMTNFFAIKTEMKMN